MRQYTLYNYFRSSTSIRVRAALNLKGIDYKYVSVHLKHGEQRSNEYRRVNPEGLVPTLELPDGTVLSQSIAIIEYLDEMHPEPPLLPADAIGRARVRSLALLIACEIHPVNNLRILKELTARFEADSGAVKAWFQKWVHTSFEPLEQRLSSDAQTGEFCHGNTPGLADTCLVAQVFNNTRFDVDMSAYPVINRIFDNCLSLEAFEKAAPMAQPDAE